MWRPATKNPPRDAEGFLSGVENYIFFFMAEAAPPETLSWLLTL
jgi:hypothetical protein